MNKEMNLLDWLLEEKEMKLKGRIYHHTQIKFSYNTNRIEGSELSEEQTRFIYEINRIFFEKEKSFNVDDIIETKNHFRCFDYMLETVNDKLSSDIIKEYHRLLKQLTSDSEKKWFKVGDYKLLPNAVGGIETVKPEKVSEEIEILIDEYSKKDKIVINDILDFHYNFEKIHPFQDGNGRVGRLIMFKECLKNDIVPFIITDKNKRYYYQGLNEYEKIPDILKDICSHEQDEYKKTLQYLEIGFSDNN